ncbi:cytochrome d ubiquinol oxidase subunit II [Sphingomonas trueperi]|uniref:cytochrome d ubiquinol oxidase subunit II n=1 Tax=Sphingomonas trueperi TaxID=53317 RepID=UPI000EAEB4FC
MIEFWTGALALTIFLYVTLDGFDLGVGMLMPLASERADRGHVIAAIAPVWDGNETWLVLTGTILFGMFPLAYATLLSAFHLPLIVMLCALIFRGVSFEYRAQSTWSRAFWDRGFVVGSYVATFMQGAAVGALVHGLPMEGDRYVGGTFGWFSPFALFCGVGLCIGYALLGAGWLTYKTEHRVQDLAFRLIPRLLAALALFLAIVFAIALTDHLSVVHRWLQAPILFMFPAMGAAAGAVMLWAVWERREILPFFAAIVLFAAAMGTLALSFYPYMIPFAITTYQAAAPAASLSFMFWGGGLVILPLTLVYTSVVYFFFKGKVAPGGHGQ